MEIIASLGIGVIGVVCFVTVVVGAIIFLVWKSMHKNGKNHD